MAMVMLISLIFQLLLPVGVPLMRRRTLTTMEPSTSLIILLVIPLTVILASQARDLGGKAVSLTPTFTCATLPQEEFGNKPDREKAKIAVLALAQTAKDLSLEYQGLKNQSDITKRENLENLGKTRKKYLLETMQRDPKGALSAILSDQERRELSAITQNCVEVTATVEGSLEVSHAVFFEDKESVTAYSLVTSDGRKINLYPAGVPDEALESGIKVKVKGFLLDNNLLFDASRPMPKADSLRGGIDVVSEPFKP